MGAFFYLRLIMIEVKNVSLLLFRNRIMEGML